jgi:hypothetical protein
VSSIYVVVASRVSSKQSNFFFKPKRTETQSVSVVFRFVLRNQTNFFRFVSVFRSGIETTETNKKNLQKTNLYQDVLKTINFFSVRTETNRNSTCFGLFFSRNQTKFFSVCFGCFGPVSKQPKQTELIVWRIKKVYILTNLLLFRLVFCLFRLFWNTETPCFDIEAKQPKQTSCFG